jgi:PiT family inorganic phosphate transporter
MGVFTLALVIAGTIPMTGKFHVPWWVILICSVTMAAGTSVGGWRIIRTMGIRMVKLEPFQGFAAETGAATTIEIASRLGIPVSTTHTISTAIMGVGAARNLSAVRWGVVREVVAAWILTFPVCALIGWGVTMLVRLVFPG